MLECPYCGFIGDECDFPDLFYTDCESSKGIIEQEKLLQEIQSHKLNIVTCRMCGDVFIHKIK